MSYPKEWIDNDVDRDVWRSDLDEELHGGVGVVSGAVVVLLQDVEQAQLLAVVTLQQLLPLLHSHGLVDEAEQRLVALALLQLLQHAADHVLQVHVLRNHREKSR